MFRALAPFTLTGASQVMEAPLAINLFNKTGIETPPVELAIQPEGVFSTAVGSGSKKTLASWHVTSPHEVVEFMLDLVNNPAPAPAVTSETEVAPPPAEVKSNL